MRLDPFGVLVVHVDKCAECAAAMRAGKSAYSLCDAGQKSLKSWRRWDRLVNGA